MRYTGDDVKDVFEILRSVAQNNGGGDKDKDKNNQQKQSLPIGDIGTGLGLLGEGLWSLGENKSAQMYKEGFRRGIDGNYQLTGRNLSLFGNQPMTEATKPMTGLNTAGQLGRYASKIGTGLGLIGGATYIYSFATRKSPEEFNGYKLAYNLSGLGRSILVGAKVGSGWEALVGLAFYGGQVGYDASIKAGNEIKVSYNNFKRNLTHTWLLTK